MPVTERLMAAGQWGLKLDSATPKATRDLLDFFGHIYIFDSPQRAGQSDAAMIATSRWGGIVRRRQTPFDVSGVNMIGWLGDEDGKGPIIEGAITKAPGTITQWITALVPAAVSLGTITGGGSVTNTYQWITSRQAIDNITGIFGVEYRVNKDASIDVGPTANLFVTTPTAAALRRSSGRDLNVVGISVTQLDVSIDAEEYESRHIVIDTTGAHTAAAGTATPYKDLKGNLILMTKQTTETLTPNASAASRAATLVAAGQVLRNEVRLTTDEFDIDRDVMVGDYIWVYDQDSNMVDTTNPVRYRGSTIYPIKLRVLASTWPIERGMSVWYRSGAAVWTDLTNYVLFEAPGASFEVGAGSRRLLTTP